MSVFSLEKIEYFFASIRAQVCLFALYVGDKNVRFLYKNVTYPTNFTMRVIFWTLFPEATSHEIKVKHTASLASPGFTHLGG